MTGLLLTGACNRNCAYCFTAAFRHGTPRQHASLRELDSYLDLLERSGAAQARLLGGEPSLHPRFPEVVRRCVQRIGNVAVFSNGLMPAASLRSLEALPAAQCDVLINLSWLGQQEGIPARLLERQKRTLQRLGSRAQISYTIFRPDFDLSPVLAAADETGCRRGIRLGLAHPGPGQEAAIHPKQYRQVGRRLAAFAPQLKQADITLEFDCGFVRCMFTAAELAALNASGVRSGWHCAPIIDLLPDGSAMPCFPLAGHSLQTPPGMTAGDLRAHFENSLRYYRVVGVYPECSSCPLKITERCAGGCLAAAMRRLHAASFRVQLPAARAQQRSSA